jgi:hypothetical protein
MTELNDKDCMSRLEADILKFIRLRLGEIVGEAGRQDLLLLHVTISLLYPYSNPCDHLQDDHVEFRSGTPHGHGSGPYVRSATLQKESYFDTYRGIITFAVRGP